VGFIARGQILEAERLARIFVDEVETTSQYSLDAATARNSLGLSCLLQGKLFEAQTHFQRVFTQWTSAPAGDRPRQSRLDPGVNSASYLAAVTWLTGDLDRAYDLSDRAIRLATEFDNVHFLVHARLFRIYHDLYSEDFASVHRPAEDMLRLATEHGMKVYLGYAAVYLNWARSRLRLPDAGPVAVRWAIDEYVAHGNEATVALMLALLAQCEALYEDHAAAAAAINAAFARSQKTGERYFLSFIHRIHGDILLKANPDDIAPAEDAYLQAIAVANEQGARTLELLAALSLAKLYRSTARPSYASSVLSPALQGFTPTERLPQIAEARALLDWP
jgi:adenylate cyclase